MSAPKHREIYLALQDAIATGKYRPGERLPTEAELVVEYSTSRPTVARALRDLVYEGLIDRRAGSGTYVREPQPRAREGYLFGLVIPQLGDTEIFDPICREMTRSSAAEHHALLWTATSDSNADFSDHAWHSTQECITRKVSGVFFAPIELAQGAREVNERILSTLRNARIPVVLLDRDLYRHPQRSRYDRVGVDNWLAGFTLADHLLKVGATRIGFFNRSHSAETVDRRLAGYRDALTGAGIIPHSKWWAEGDPGDLQFVENFLEISGVDAIICANDFTAARLMRTLEALKVRVPEDVRIVGVDDVKYAALLGVPLTTLKQPCEYIGSAAVHAMLERIMHPAMPARDILFRCELVVRKSCGAALSFRTQD